jgi:predicted ribosome quality control (RQC) complex YloA/Tae2 family protein
MKINDNTLIVYVDHLTLACLRDRLDGLLGARVQRIVLPDEFSVGLELYAGQRFQLLVSAHSQFARTLLAPQKLRRGAETATPLLLLLRKWVRGGRLVDVTQPPWERILTLHFEGPAGPCRLVAEMIGRYSNVVLVGPGERVLEATKRIGPDLNRYRVTLPAHPYQPPPTPPGRQPPTEVKLSAWVAMLASAAPDEPLHRLLTHRLLAVSPMVAREVAARAAGDPEAEVFDASPAALATAAAEIFAPLEDGTWSPHVALDEEENVIAFAPYEPHQFERIEPVSSISDAMWRYFQQRFTVDGYAAIRQQVQELINQAQSRTARALEQLQAEVVDEEGINALRKAGELLLAYQGQVKRGAREVTLPDYEGVPRTIALDPTLTLVENAQAYFRRYRKANRAAEKIPARIETFTADQAYLEQLAADLALAELRPEIDEVRRALAEGGWTPKAHKQKSSRVSGPRHVEVGGFPIYVGRNARQNEQVTFKQAGPDDLWLHARDLPGAHVIIKSGTQDAPEEVIQRAAELAAYYSPARDSGRAAVVVTRRRFVRRLPGGHPGLVTYRNERTVWVEPRA